MKICIFTKFLSAYTKWKKWMQQQWSMLSRHFIEAGLRQAKLHDQCYDACSTMMGEKKGATTLIKWDLQALALSSHCYAHSLNLTCGDWIKNSTIVSNSLDTSYEITKLVKFSSKRDSHLRKIHEGEYYQNEKKHNCEMKILRLFSQTRWTVRASTLSSIWENYKEVEELWN